MKNNTFKLWQLIEALSPPEAARVNAGDHLQPVYGVGADGVLPWKTALHNAKRLESGWTWMHVAQCGIFSVDTLTREILMAMGGQSDEWMETSGAQSRLFDLSFDSAGNPLPHSLSLSLSAWAAGQILLHGGSVSALLGGGAPRLEGLPVPDESLPTCDSGYPAFDALTSSLMQWISNELENLRAREGDADVFWLTMVTKKVAEHLGFPEAALNVQAPVRVRSVQVRSSKTHEKNEKADILSSFFVEDLARIDASVSAGKAGKGLLQYLSGGGGKFKVERVDVRTAQASRHIWEALKPERIPRGRWPADHSLVFSQQLAVNEAFASLANDAGIFAVNGPPGTGKTTLLRDVVAGVVTQRAMELVKTRTSHFGPKQLLRLAGAAIPYYPVHESLQGHSIVIATSNNGAAENVSLELPGRNAVPERVASASRYFPEIASNVIQKDAWGLMAAALGNRQNRNAFLSRFWWGSNPASPPSYDSATGLRDTLRLLLQPGSKPSLGWKEAVDRFSKALTEEGVLREEMSRWAKLPDHIAHITLRIKSDEAALVLLQKQLEESADAVNVTRRHVAESKELLDQATRAVLDTQTQDEAHQRNRPGFFTWLKSLGRSHRDWDATWTVIKRNLATAQSMRNDLEKVHQKASAIAHAQASNHTQIDQRVQLHVDALQRAHENLRGHKEALAKAHEILGGCWPTIEAEPFEREASAPWAHPDWLRAREEVFLAALDVHRAFIEAHPAQMIANLGLASDWLSGKPLPAEVAKLALDSLCLVVPAISTTFASMPRMFASIGSQAIGYLLIDETGQAIPAHAACAIWRARRSVLVGDPRQLEPVSSMPVALEQRLAAQFGVGDAWLPGTSSAQALADLSSRLGTWLVDDTGHKTWVGCPLRLHRRCDQPMFAISNAIAYSGMMVFGKKAPKAHPLPASIWLDVQSEASKGHWIPEEEACLRRLLHVFERHGVASDEIALISPFRDCAMNLRRIAREFELDLGKVGTVHTAQGKEADVVVLVLGGNPSAPGAKAWAARKPNLLNVAVSRSKKRLYVIGDRDKWKLYSYFSTMAHYLPETQELTAAAQECLSA